MLLEEKIRNEVAKLEGPIIVYGTSGFIGSNLFKKIYSLRKDCFAVTSQSFTPWRLNDVDPKNILHSNILNKEAIEKIWNSIQPKVIFNLAAYGAYSTQNDISLIYQTNLVGLLNLLEVSEKKTIKALVHAGSSSEYGLNCKAPNEEDEKIPNSHYSISKISTSYLIKYYGNILGFPIVNLRYYSVYGPYEEADRLVPQLIKKGAQKTYPPLVQPDISRDFIYIDDVVYATLLSANLIDTVRGHSLNVASGINTTIREIVNMIQEIFGIKENPEFGHFPNRKWDLVEWYGNVNKIQKMLNWRNETSLKEGLVKTYEWQKNNVLEENINLTKSFKR